MGSYLVDKDTIVIDDFVDQVVRLYSKGIKMSYYLWGPSGCGKTATIRRLANCYGERPYQKMNNIYWHNYYGERIVYIDFLETYYSKSKNILENIINWTAPINQCFLKTMEYPELVNPIPGANAIETANIVYEELSLKSESYVLPMRQIFIITSRQSPESVIRRLAPDNFSVSDYLNAFYNQFEILYLNETYVDYSKLRIKSPICEINY